MRFEVEFRSLNGYAVEIHSAQIGLDGVKKIRDALGVELPLDRIQGVSVALKQDPFIALKEETARDSGHFADINKINVAVKDGSLNRFAEPRVEVDATKNTETGEILNAWIAYALNIKALLAAWRDAGFPLEWTLPDENQEKQE